MRYGYARVSTRQQANEGYSLEAQEHSLIEHGAKEIYFDVFTGQNDNRPKLKELLDKLISGDTLIVSKLDRIARNLIQGHQLINGLIERGVKVHILDIGFLDNTPNSQFQRNILLSVAEFELNQIKNRLAEGKEIARTKNGFREGRPKKFNTDQLDYALHLLDDHTYKKVERITGISESTMRRERSIRKKSALEKELETVNNEDGQLVLNDYLT